MLLTSLVAYKTKEDDKLPDPILVLYKFEDMDDPAEHPVLLNPSTAPAPDEHSVPLNPSSDSAPDP